MEFLAYALFIVVLAIPYLVVLAIAALFVAGIAGLIVGITKRQRFNFVMGLALVLVSSGAGWTLRYWATTPPATDHPFVLHQVVHQTYQSLRARHLAMRWLLDGTFERLAKEQRQQQPRPNPDGPLPR